MLVNCTCFLKNPDLSMEEEEDIFTLATGSRNEITSPLNYPHIVRQIGNFNWGLINVTIIVSTRVMYFMKTLNTSRHVDVQCI